MRILKSFVSARNALAIASLLTTGVASAQGLPGGATSLNETHGDWTVACHAPDGTVRCAMTQTQINGENRQRVLAIELTPASGGSEVSGIVVLPFGLRLEAGVGLMIEGGGQLPTARFSTCLPAGCVVPLAFDAETVLALRSGTALNLAMTANDTGQNLALSVSLTGFGSALNRIAQLLDS